MSRWVSSSRFDILFLSVIFECIRILSFQSHFQKDMGCASIDVDVASFNEVIVAFHSPICRSRNHYLTQTSNYWIYLPSAAIAEYLWPIAYLTLAGVLCRSIHPQIFSKSNLHCLKHVYIFWCIWRAVAVCDVWVCQNSVKVSFFSISYFDKDIDCERINTDVAPFSPSILTELILSFDLSTSSALLILLQSTYDQWCTQP